ncbi:MAG: flagellar export protein FliJ, partial [Planctomycetota bacterium]|nr:flagellar export protein FliJ [Planctomycetota bacterium]
RFRFQLQAILRYREMVEEQRKKEYAAANRQADEERLRREAMLADREALQDNIREIHTSHLPFYRLLDSYRYLHALDIDLARNAAEMVRLETIREERRQALLEARKRRRALEILKARRQAEHAYQSNREEQAALDEIAVQAKRRRRG